MSFNHAPARRFYVVRASCLFVVAIGIGAFSLAPDVDAQGRFFCFVFVTICVIRGLFDVWQARRSSSNAIVTAHHIPSSVPAQICYYRRAFIFSTVIIPIISGLIAYDLYQIKSGALPHTIGWKPAAFIYEKFGYWPAMVLLPTLGFIWCAFVIYKLRKLKRTLRNSSRTLNQPLPF